MSNLIESVKKCSAIDFIFILLGFLGLLAPGFLVLYLYKPTLIGDLGTLKLFVFSFCLTSPAFMLTAIAIAFFYSSEDSDQAQKKQQESDDLFKWIFLMGTSVTFILFYVLLVIAYLFKLNFKTFLITMIVLESIILILGISSCIISEMNKKRNRQ